MLRTIFYVAIFLVFPLLSQAQERPIKDLTPDKRHKVGEKMLGQASYYNAVDHMKKLVDEHPSKKEYIMELANAYFFSRDYKNAEIWYKKHVDLDTKQKQITLALFRYAECLKYNAKYQEAQKAFKEFSESRYRDRRPHYYKKYASNEALSCVWAENNNELVLPVEITHLGGEINSAYSDFAPCPLNDSTLIFSSLQSDSVITVKADEAHSHMVKLYRIDKKDNNWTTQDLIPNVNSVFENNANGTFSPDKKRFYFTRCIQNRAGNMVCKIYVSKVENGSFSRPKKLPSKINRKGYSSTQPHVSQVESRGRTYEIMIYSSDRKGGRGGMDLWYTIIDSEKGTYRTPGNLGRNINTLRDEVTPFYDSTSSTLYFSSNYHYGFGGFDVFSARGALNRYSDPVNIGKPVNTRVDDTYYNIKGDKQEGYLVSNRPEGYHLTSETCCDDIYSHQLEKDLMLVKLSAYNSKVDRKELKDVKLKLFEKSGAFIKDSLIFGGDTIKVQRDTIGTLVILSPDSAAHINILKVLEYMGKGDKPKPVKPNTIISGGKYIELKTPDNSFLIFKEKTYLAAAAGATDTVYFLLRTSEEQILSNTFIPDTSLTNSNEKKLPDFTLANIEFFFSKVVDSAFITASANREIHENQIESEKSNTVGKVINEIEEISSRTRNKEIEGEALTPELKIILNYDFDDTKFIEKHSGSLDSLASMLNRYPRFVIFIAAHTDGKGSDTYNMNLSKRRYKTIIDYLAQKGISRKRMSGKGFGETEPLVPNLNPDGTDNPENRWLNRRAEITILEK